MGDYNVSYNSNSENKKFKSIITINGFKQITKHPTQVINTSSILIELVCTNCVVNVTHTYIIISLPSDHNMIGTVKKINQLKYSSRTIKCRNYVTFDSQTFCNDISEIGWS